MAVTVSSYVAIVESICSIGIITNLLLLLIVLKCHLNSFKLAKYYFTFISIQNTIMVVCYSVLAPKMAVFDHSYVFLATGQGSQWIVAPALILVYNTTLISTLVYSTKSFIYRFIHLCRPQLSFIYTSAKYMLLLKAVNIALILNWDLMIYFVCWPNSAFTANVHQFMMKNFNFMLANHAFIGFSTKLLSGGDWAFFTETLVLLLVLAGTAFCCALRVHFYLNGNSISSQTKKLQRTFFIVLLIQTACPVIFLYLPLLSMFVMLFVGWNTPAGMSFGSGILMSTYPFFSSVIIMLYMKDYRRFILRLFGIKNRRPSGTTTIMFVAAAEGKIAPQHSSTGK